jgi:hypothetical protein
MLGGVMPRPLRIEFAGAAYQVMARGNQGRRRQFQQAGAKLELLAAPEAIK